jgi:uncharacterized protein with PQ loop repeat
MNHILFILISLFIILILKIYFDKCLENYENKKNKENKKTIFGLDKNTWGWISVVTNGISVIIQMLNLYTTKSAQSFSMKFIVLMTVLNFTYFVLGILTENIGLAIATFMFVIYNITVVYYFYYGKK